MIFSHSTSGVPVLSKLDLEHIADSHTRDFVRFNKKDDLRFSVWKFAAHYLEIAVRFEYLSNNACILGMSVFVDGTKVPFYQPDSGRVLWKQVEANTILLDESLNAGSLTNISKSRFTLMHESAHQILHSQYFRNLAKSPGNHSIAYSTQKDLSNAQTETAPSVAWTDTEWIEWQANYLASALLMPKRRVLTALKEYNFYEYYRARVNQKVYEPTAYRLLVRDLARAFRVSDTTAKIRLESIGFERLDNLWEPKPDPYGPDYLAPRNRDPFQTTRTDDDILEEWEARYLDPDYSLS